MQSETNAEAIQSVTLEHPSQRGLIVAAQLLIYPALLLLRLVLVRRTPYRHPALYNLAADKTYVVYANHQSMLDPLIICASLPPSALRRLLPFRFFIENTYFKGIAKPILYGLGGFPAHYQPGQLHGLDKARRVMSTRQTIVIFPQGRRTQKLIAKPGIVSLGAEPNVVLIPIQLNWTHRWRCELRIGQPFVSSPASTPQQLMQNVYDLTPTTT